MSNNGIVMPLPGSLPHSELEKLITNVLDHGDDFLYSPSGPTNFLGGSFDIPRGYFCEFSFDCRELLYADLSALRNCQKLTVSMTESKFFYVGIEFDSEEKAEDYSTLLSGGGVFSRPILYKRYIIFPLVYSLGMVSLLIDFNRRDIDIKLPIKITNTDASERNSLFIESIREFRNRYTGCICDWEMTFIIANIMGYIFGDPEGYGPYVNGPYTEIKYVNDLREYYNSFVEEVEDLFGKDFLTYNPYK